FLSGRPPGTNIAVMSEQRMFMISKPCSPATWRAAAFIFSQTESSTLRAGFFRRSAFVAMSTPVFPDLDRGFLSKRRSAARMASQQPARRLLRIEADLLTGQG